ncbi:hypothetical protein HUO09_17420 [Vibrio sp. Y2-5]|nr:hypothetical protein [Vibrio sp. Y2-5]
MYSQKAKPFLEELSILQKNVHVEIDAKFCELVSDVQIIERRERILDSLPEELKQFGNVLYKS